MKIYRAAHVAALFTATVWLQTVAAADMTIYADPAVPTVQFGVGDLEAALVAAGHQVTIKDIAALPAQPRSSFVFVPATHPKLKQLGSAAQDQLETLEPEGFWLSPAGTSYWCIGDRKGLMYGAFELTELVKNDDLKSVQASVHNPFLEKRGLKMNIPLDARTPSYADTGTAAQANIEQVWDMAFWQAQLDRMARNRYNAYTLWNLHPFPSLVKLKKYPKVAKRDIMKAKVDWVDQNKGYNTKGLDMVNDDILANLKTVKRMSIDQKIAFWREVMQYGHDRGIEFHFYTWNVFTYGAEGIHGISKENWQSDVTIDYFYESVKATFETYPLLKGMGITAGEGFGHASDEEEEDWLWATYGRAVQAVRQANPERHIEFVHRTWWADSDVIKDRFAPLINDPGVTFNFSYKYAFARLYSEAGPGQHRKNKVDNQIKELPPGGRYWWNLRNDDIFNFRWGDYNFVQNFITNLPPREHGLGIHMGSDGYVWGREFTDRKPQRPRQLEHDKHWLKFMLWGRLAFDPNTSEQRFEQEALRRLACGDPALLMKTWKAASRIIPAVNRYHWHNWDFQWSVEYNHSRPSGWHDLERWAKKSKSSWQSVATEIASYADEVQAALPTLRKTGKDTEYLKTLSDLECFAHLGHFYATRIIAAHHLDQKNKSETIRYATESAAHWKAYAELASSLYTDQILARPIVKSWKELHQKALEDIPR